MSSCELPLPGRSAADAACVSARRSRLHRFRPGAGPAEPNTWSGVPLQEYKPAADHHCGVLRSVLVGASGERTRFQLRYFEIAPGGHTTLEHHRHEHVVVVLRGEGQVRLDDTWHAIGVGDTVYVAPDEVHQLRNHGGEPFGFFCLVDAERDAPVPLTQG